MKQNVAGPLDRTMKRSKYLKRSKLEYVYIWKHFGNSKLSLLIFLQLYRRVDVLLTKIILTNYEATVGVKLCKSFMSSPPIKTMQRQEALS